MADTLFDKGKPPRKPRRAPRKLMHVYDAGPAEGPGCMVVMKCSRFELRTSWFWMPSVTAAKRGIPCPKCSKHIGYKVDEYGEYVPPALS